MSSQYKCVRSGVVSACLLGLTGALIMPAMAQVERIPFRGEGPRGDDIGDARFLRSGALLIASFDADHDFVVTDAEIEAGARNTFKFADADGSGGVSPLEQRAWAGRITSETDVLGNASLFISATPGHVSEDEFVAGLKTFAGRFRNEDGDILFSALTFEPKAKDKSKQPDDDVARLRRPTVSGQEGGSR